MYFRSLGEFLRYLESLGEVRRIKAEVDPYLEVTEIAVRSLRENKPVLLFENVKGSKFPLVINTYGSERRIEHALGRHPEQIGQDLYRFADDMMPPRLASLWHQRSTVRRALAARSRRTRRQVLPSLGHRPGDQRKRPGDLQRSHRRRPQGGRQGLL